MKMLVSAAHAKHVHVPVKGFDGGLYEYQGRQYSITSTHGWALLDKDLAATQIVVFQPHEPVEGEPHSYVMDRTLFLSLFTKVPTE